MVSDSEYGAASKIHKGALHALTTQQFIAFDQEISLCKAAEIQRTGDSRHGMGLGLSICKSIIRAHGGTIEGRNGDSRGAVFTITLPKEETHE